MEKPFFPHEMIEIHGGVSRYMNICIYIYNYMYRVNCIYIPICVRVCCFAGDNQGI